MSVGNPTFLVKVISKKTKNQDSRKGPILMFRTGGPTAAVIALHNPHIRVDVLDKDPRRVRRWNSPHLPIYESGLIDIVRVSRDGAKTVLRAPADKETQSPSTEHIPNLFFTTDSQTSLAKADMVMLAVNTPTKTFGIGCGRATNMTTFDAAAKEVALYARPGTIIVEKSTVPCGTAQRVRKMVSIIVGVFTSWLHPC